jgi:hypothetical protein
MKNLIFLICAAALTIQAQGMDIRGDGKDYIKIEYPADGYISFEYCLNFDNGEKCDPLGPSQSYRLQDLKTQRNIEWLQAFMSSVPATGAVVIGLYSGAKLGAYLGFKYAIDALGGGINGLFYGAAVGGSGVGVSILYFDQLDPINPLEQAWQARAIRDAVLNDEDVKVGSVSKAAERLELILNKL